MPKTYDIVTLDQKQFLEMVGELPFSKQQINLLMQKTPNKFIKSRPIPGGGNADFVEGSYVIGLLNLVTGYQWDFDVLEEKEAHEQIIIRGRLTIQTQNGKTLGKTQYGRAPIKYKTTLVGGKKVPTEKTVDYGNDHKAAVTDAIKKCASLFGVAWDVFGKEDTREMQLYDAQTQEAEIILQPIEEIIEIVTAKLATMTTVEKMRILKTTGHTDTKKLSDFHWRKLHEDIINGS